MLLSVLLLLLLFSMKQSAVLKKAGKLKSGGGGSTAAAMAMRGKEEQKNVEKVAVTCRGKWWAEQERACVELCVCVGGGCSRGRSFCVLWVAHGAIASTHPERIPSKRTTAQLKTKEMKLDAEE